MLEMRESWTDARLDDFAANVDRRFDAVDLRFDAVDQRFKEVDRRFDEVDRRFDRVEDDLRGMRADMDRRFESMQKQMQVGFESMHRLMVQSSVAVIVALIALIATQV